jgi:hypothetical protein
MTFSLNWKQLHTQGDEDAPRWSGSFPYSTNTTRVHNDPMTAIVFAYTDDGFVIGADGRRMESGVIVSEKIQKIFWFEWEEIRIAYAWAGTTMALNREEKSMLDVLTASQESLLDAAQLEPDSFVSFFSFFCSFLYKRIPSRITNMPDGELARGVIVGHYRGTPCKAEIELRYVNSYLNPNVELHTSIECCHRRIFSGAESVFLKSYTECKPQSRTEAIDFVRNYIQDCVDSSDADCIGIGGRVHIAELTPENISWIDPPISK